MVEDCYYLTSLASDAKQFGLAVRTHSSIDNGLHGVPDVVFQEGQSRLRRDHTAENFAVLRQPALSLPRREQTCPNGINVKYLKAAWDEQYLTRVLFSYDAFAPLPAVTSESKAPTTPRQACTSSRGA